MQRNSLSGWQEPGRSTQAFGHAHARPSGIVPMTDISRWAGLGQVVSSRMLPIVQTYQKVTLIMLAAITSADASATQ